LLILGVIHVTHPAATQLLDNAVVRNGLADHWRESYVCETGKSMKAVELAVCQSSRWRNIPIHSKYPRNGEQTAQACANAWLHQFVFSVLFRFDT